MTTAIPSGTVSAASASLVMRVALLGNPNTGKTTLFNRLTGLRHKTSNFPGTTLEARTGRYRADGLAIPAGPVDCCGPDDSPQAAGPITGSGVVEIIDLPGIYSLELEQLESQVCRDVLAGRAAPRGDRVEEPDGVCAVLDATNLGRNLLLAGEVLRRRLPTVIAVNMIDLARRQGLSVDAGRLSAALGCPVVLISARTGEGLDALKAELARTIVHGDVPTRTPPGDSGALRVWADETYAQAASGGAAGAGETRTDRVDRVLTHPVLGTLGFVLIMAGLFYMIFAFAQYPMDAIGKLFEIISADVASVLPEGLLSNLLCNGVIAGIGTVLVFLPQICLLFFLISLLEDTGYLARAAFVMDRVLRPFGLPGHSFVPLLSSHACALPGIMSTRGIPDRRERLATILVAPFMACSARLPVYILLTGLLFEGRPFIAALAFVGCYAAGIIAGVVSAFIARGTILRGVSRPMALELPTYKWPSLRTALTTMYERGWTFVKNAGTNILAIVVILWWLGAFPAVDAPPAAKALQAQAQALRAQAEKSPKDAQEKAEADAKELEQQADTLTLKNAKEHSFVGTIGKAIQPVFAPLGYDWQLTVGVMTSFAARETFVSTMSVVLEGEDGDAKDISRNAAFLKRIGLAERTDTPPGRPARKVFEPAVCWSLLVFFVLAMQCLPTLVVTAREAGGVKWALLQLAWMSTLAYAGAFIAYHIALKIYGGA